VKARMICQWLSISLLACLLGGCKDPLTKILKEFGLARCNPPRSSLGPGTIVTLPRSTEGKVSVNVLCWRDQAFPGAAAPKDSPTLSADLRKKVTGSLELEAEIMKKVKAEAQFKSVKNIILSLSNVAVVENSIADLGAVAEARIPACSQAVEQAQRAKEEVYYVLQALRADVVYTVETEVSAGASVKLDATAMANLAGSLGGSVGSEASQTISGTSLYWGLGLMSVLPVERGVPFAAVKSSSLAPPNAALLEALAREEAPWPERSEADKLLSP
jgi:hypothetical protein